MRRNFYFLLLVLIGCQSAERNTPLEKFKAVDSSLKKAQNNLEPSVRRSFDSSGKLLSSVFDSTLFQIFRLKKKLAKTDPSLGRLDMGDSLIIESREGRDLYRRMKACLDLSKNKGNLQNEFSFSETEWLRRYFHNIPTIAIITILSKFQADIQRMQ